MSKPTLLLQRGETADPAGAADGSPQAADTGEHAKRQPGAFSVAMREADGSVALAIDRFAIQPMCYRVDGDTLRYAPRADELAAPGEALDPQALYDYLYFHCIPSPRTVYRDVRRLTAGHTARLRAGRVEVEPFWRPRFTEPQRAPDFAALRSEFLDLLKASVSRQLDGSKPACFLSGGTDSSTVSGMASRLAGQPTHTYSIGFEAEGYDEMEYARIASRHFGTQHHEYYVTPADLVRSIPMVAASYDQPFGNSSALPSYYCALKARDDGVTRVLAGDGGDELFGGNTRYAKQRVFAAYDALPAGLRRALLDPLGDSSLLKSLPLARKVSNYIAQARLPLPARLETYNLLERLDPEALLTPAFLRGVDRQSPHRQQQQVWDAADAGSRLNRHLAFDWRYTLAENDLVKVRGACELAGLQVAFPLLDPTLVDFSARLPVDYKLKGVTLRWFFKEALKDFLPEQIITKKKHGFGLPFGVWATRHAPLLELASDSLHGLVRRGMVREPFVTALLKTHLPEHPGYYGEMVWILMMLEQWLAAKASGYRVE